MLVENYRKISATNYRIIDGGKSDLDIAIELELSAKDMLGFRLEYLTLKGEDDLLRVYRAIGSNMPAFLWK